LPSPARLLPLAGSTPQRLPPCRWLCHGSDWPWGCPRPGARGGGRRSVAQDPLLVPEGRQSGCPERSSRRCVAVGPCVGVGDGQVPLGVATGSGTTFHSTRCHPYCSQPTTIRICYRTALLAPALAPPPGSVITHEASPLALRSTRNRLRTALHLVAAWG
jgi:hypothetical protein